MESRKGKMMLGFSVKSTAKGIRPLHVFKDGPADKAGIKAGDLIEKIDGKPTLGMTAAEFVRLVEASDPLVLSIVPREGEPKDVTVAKVEGSKIGGVLSGPPADLLEVSVGQEPPDFEATTAGGEKIRLSDLKGRPVLINFTATWCQPCRMQMPKLVEAYAKFKERGFEIVSVYLDSGDKDVVGYARELGSTWPIRNDMQGWEGDVAKAYGVSGVPTNILVGKDGKVLHTNLVGSDLETSIERSL